MTREDDFDAFYHANRETLVHQTFAVSGDLVAAREAVRDAAVAAWHHWRSVSAGGDPHGWVRRRAWQQVRRHHRARWWRRTPTRSEHDAAVLAALRGLPADQRRTLVLTQLTGLSLAETARELGVTVEQAEQHLQAATAACAIALDVDSATIRAQLVSLARTAADARLPRASIIRRAGRKRRRTRAAAAALATAGAAVVAAAVVQQPGDLRADTHPRTPAAGTADPSAPGVTEDPAEPRELLPTPDQLLGELQIERLGPGQRWSVVTTDDNTDGDGINTFCQQDRFADPDGAAALVRTFRAHGRPHRTAVQTVEASRTARQARLGFETTLGWYAGCRLPRLQLLETFEVDHVGDRAVVLLMRAWKEPVTTYSVAVARVGRLVTSTVGRTVGAAPPPTHQVAQSLADSVAMLCDVSGGDSCAGVPRVRPAAPPPSGEAPGMLAVTDLPPVADLRRAWVGTTARPARAHRATTVCDTADFTARGVTRARTRTFLIPRARLPLRFGLSETYGVLRTPAAARRFVDRVRDRVARCERENLATEVHRPETRRLRHPAMELSTWTLSTEISKQASVRFRLGVVRVGRYVARVTFAPTAEDDFSRRQFDAVVRRAGERLRQLG